MPRLVNIAGNLVDLEYVYKIDIVLPDVYEYNKLIKDTHFVCNHELKLNKLQHLLPRGDEWTSCPNVVSAVYKIKLYIFNIDKPETFYFAHEDEFNKFINAYKEHRKVSEILEI